MPGGSDHSHFEANVMKEGIGKGPILYQAAEQCLQAPYMMQSCLSSQSLFRLVSNHHQARNYPSTHVLSKIARYRSAGGSNASDLDAS